MKDHVSLSTACSVDVQGVSPSTVSSVDVQSVPRTLYHPCPVFVNPEMLDCPATGSPVPELKRMTIPEQVRYRIKGTQSDTGILRYRTEMSSECRCYATINRIATF
jgi:hypothetical protein